MRSPKRAYFLGTKILALIALLVVCQPARAATIEVHEFDKMAVVAVVGQLTPEDGAAFARKVENITRRTIVFLIGPGGHLQAGLRIGTIIQLKEFETLVPEGEMCASACALAWLAGRNRFLEQGARIGFHAAALESSGGRKKETGAGNALVGAYLNRIGLSDKAILALTLPPPNQMLWLTPQMARDLGIKIAMVPQSTTRNESKQPPAAVEKAAPRPTKRPSPKDLDAVARHFVETYFAHWSESNGQALRYFRRVYAEQVHFFGQPRDSKFVLANIQDYIGRWPERVYTAMPDTLKTRCDQEARICDVTGIVEWDSSSADGSARAVGAGEYTFRISVTTRGAVRIQAENLKVIRRGP